MDVKKIYSEDLQIAQSLIRRDIDITRKFSISSVILFSNLSMTTTIQIASTAKSLLMKSI